MVKSVRNSNIQAEMIPRSVSHEQLYRSYYPRVRWICLGFTFDSMEAEDLCQEVFMAVFRNWLTFRGESNPMTWISTIARNICLNHARKKKIRTGHDLELYREAEAAPEYRLEDRYGARIQFAQTLANANDVNQSILRWYFRDGWHQSEIAVKLGVSRVAVTQAITRVRKQWRESGVTPGIPAPGSKSTLTKNANYRPAAACKQEGSPASESIRRFG